MSDTVTSSRPVASNGAEQLVPGARSALGAALIGFFMITLDAVIVNVALPAIQRDLGGGMTGQQWVLDSYTIMFAALLLSAGSVSDRIGARRALGIGLTAFIAASAACGFAPSLGVLVAARAAQGAAAALTMPATLTLLREAYPDPAKRARAVAVWAVGGVVASTAGPVLGGFLSLISWRMIFFINLPVGAGALLLLTVTRRSPRRPAPFDWAGQVAAVLAMGGLTYGVIEAGASGFMAPRVFAALAVAVVAAVAFVVVEAQGKHPMVPLGLFRSRIVVIAMAVGFAFMVTFYGVPFLFSLYFQQLRGLSPLVTGLAFLPMMAPGAILTPLTARLAERFGPRATITSGLLLMAVGLTVLSAVPESTPTWVFAVLMIPVGCGGPLTMPPVTALLLDAVPASRAGTASGAFHTSRQLGGALTVAVFGTVLADRANFLPGLSASLLTAAVVVFATAVASLLLRNPQR